MTLFNLLVVLLLAIAFFFLAAFLFLVPVVFTLHSLFIVALVPAQLLQLVRSKRVRQNHALEHATINILEEKSGKLNLAGLSSSDGFTLFGLDDLKAVEAAARDGLNRLKNKEGRLAIHKECGTGRGVVHLTSALIFLFLLLVSGRFSFLYILPALTVSALLGPLLGRLAQRFLTTSTDLDRLTIESAAPLEPSEHILSPRDLPGVFVRTKIDGIC